MNELEKTRAEKRFPGRRRADKLKLDEETGDRKENGAAGGRHGG